MLTVASASADFQGAYLTLPEVPPGDEVEVGGHLSCMLTPQPPRGHKRYNHTVVLTPRLHLLGREMAGAAHAVDVPSKHPVQFRPSDVPTCVAPGEEGFPITLTVTNIGSSRLGTTRSIGLRVRVPTAIQCTPVPHPDAAFSRVGDGSWTVAVSRLGPGMST